MTDRTSLDYDKAYENIAASAFKDIDGYYLDPNTTINKKVFKNWDNSMRDLQNWQKTTEYFLEYDLKLRDRIKDYNKDPDIHSKN